MTPNLKPKSIRSTSEKSVHRITTRLYILEFWIKKGLNLIFYVSQQSKIDLWTQQLKVSIFINFLNLIKGKIHEKKGLKL